MIILKASLLRDKIILYHDRLADRLLSLLRTERENVDKVGEALKVAKELEIISENNYKLLREFNQLRGQTHHGTYLSRYSKKNLEELEREVENAKSIIKQIISKKGRI